ncbi:hypothetical protein ACOME3_003149 [Neoechinorhynchus agilis]
MKNIKQRELGTHISSLKNSSAKLLYNCVSVSKPMMQNVAKWMIGNAVVVETDQEAYRLGSELWNYKYTVISLEGTMYRSDVSITAGKADLASKAKKWDHRKVVAMDRLMMSGFPLF